MACPIPYAGHKQNVGRCPTWWRRRYSNEGKTRNPLIYAGVPKTGKPISAVSYSKKFATLWDLWRRYCCLTSFSCFSFVYYGGHYIFMAVQWNRTGHYTFAMWFLLIMVALWNRADHYTFILWFLLLSSSFFFSSPILSRRRLDVCHTSTHDVALVRI